MSTNLCNEWKYCSLFRKWCPLFKEFVHYVCHCSFFTKHWPLNLFCCMKCAILWLEGVIIHNMEGGTKAPFLSMIHLLCHCEVRPINDRWVYFVVKCGRWTDIVITQPFWHPHQSSSNTYKCSVWDENIEESNASAPNNFLWKLEQKKM